MDELKCGLLAMNFGQSSYAHTLGELAKDSEESGWDGFFVADTMMNESARAAPTVDPFVALTSISLSTRRIRIGTMVTALARRRPWKVARETVSIDHISNGRLVLGVGLGDPPETEFEVFGEDGNNKVRAEKLDEGLEILTGLWSGQEFKFKGKHFRIDNATFLPRPFQKPRIPIWVGGSWPNKAPFRRAARWDGVIPIKFQMTGRVEPQDIRELLTYIKKFRTNSSPLDVVIIGRETFRGQDDVSEITLLREAGLTWWVESLSSLRDSPKEMSAKIREGPPRI